MLCLFQFAFLGDGAMILLLQLLAGTALITPIVVLIGIALRSQEWLQFGAGAALLVALILGGAALLEVAHERQVGPEEIARRLENPHDDFSGLCIGIFHLWLFPTAAAVGAWMTLRLLAGPPAARLEVERDGSGRDGPSSLPNAAA